MEIGDNIAFISEGELTWSGDKKSIMSSDCQVLNDFVCLPTLQKTKAIKKG
jgi:ABC-type transporter Mla maintaining outer membrane lipid asymmetry ATPase subunit MlaF